MGSQKLILILEKTDSMFGKKGVIWMFLLFKKIHSLALLSEILLRQNCKFLSGFYWQKKKKKKVNVIENKT